MSAFLTWLVDLIRPRLDEPPLDLEELELALCWALSIVMVVVLAATALIRL